MGGGKEKEKKYSQYVVITWVIVSYRAAVQKEEKANDKEEEGKEEAEQKKEEGDEEEELKEEEADGKEEVEEVKD